MVLLAALLACLVVSPLAAADAPTLPEVLRLRAELHVAKIEAARLRAALADAQARLAGAELSAERAGLEPEIRKALGCAADATIDWTAFVAAPGAPARPPCSAAPAPHPQ